MPVDQFPCLFPRSAWMDLRPWKKRSHGAVYGDGASAANGLAHPLRTPPGTKLLAHLLGFNLLHGSVATCNARHVRVSTHGKDSTSEAAAFTAFRGASERRVIVVRVGVGDGCLPVGCLQRLPLQRSQQ